MVPKTLPGTDIPTVAIVDDDPWKWLLFEVGCADEVFWVFRADETSKHHNDIYRKFLSEIDGTEVEFRSMVDGGKMEDFGDKAQTLLGFSADFKVPKPMAIDGPRADTAKFLATHGHEFKLRDPKRN